MDNIETSKHHERVSAFMRAFIRHSLIYGVTFLIIAWCVSKQLEVDGFIVYSVAIFASIFGGLLTARAEMPRNYPLANSDAAQTIERTPKQIRDLRVQGVAAKFFPFFVVPLMALASLAALHFEFSIKWACLISLILSIALDFWFASKMVDHLHRLGRLQDNA